MPIFKTTDLTTTNSPSIDTVMPCIQNGVTKQISVFQIKQYLDDGTVKEISSGDGYQCNPNPITGPDPGSISFVSPGLMSLYAGWSDPTGWLICNGRSFSTSSYPELFAKIGYRYGGSGASFNIPNLVGRAVFGLDNMASTSAGRVTVSGANTLGATAGNYQTTLTQAETPLVSHTHTVPGSFSVSWGANRYGNNLSLSTGRPRTGFNTSSGGCSTTLTLTIATSSQPLNVPGTSAHPNLPPFMLLNWIIKI